MRLVQGTRQLIDWSALQESGGEDGVTQASSFDALSEAAQVTQTIRCEFQGWPGSGSSGLGSPFCQLWGRLYFDKMQGRHKPEGLNCCRIIPS